MNGLDIESVLANAIEREYGLADPLNEGYKPESRTLARILAAVLREQVAEWLESEAAFFAASDAIIDVRDAHPRISDDAPSDDVARAALSALAAQLAPARVPSEEG